MSKNPRPTSICCSNVFFSAVMDPKDNIVGHISKLEDIAQQLRDQGETVSDTMVISKVLMTLPTGFSHFHSVRSDY